MWTLAQLIAEPKNCEKRKRQKKASEAFHQWEFPLEHQNVAIEGRFFGYLRVNADLPERFSVGLRYEDPRAGNALLLRLNGDHGVHRNPGEKGPAFDSGVHLHEPTEEESVTAWAPGFEPRFAKLLPPAHQQLTTAWLALCQHASITV
jgi:hypothetical protein